MALLITTSPAADRIIGALCNTLLHSLWQGLLLAAATGLIVLLTRRHSAARRYNLLISALALFAVGVGITFAVQLMQAQPLTPYTNAVVGNGITGSGSIYINVSPQSFTDNLFSYLNQHHNGIVSIWFLIICAKSIQLVVGLLGVRRLKYTKVYQVGADWYTRLQQLADSLAIDRKVALLESALAKVPMVIGTLKPMILIPVGLLTALSTEEVEAILIHELAHIKRRDYLVNLLQSLMEIVFFFNPAVLWISQLIRAERENCCDDMVIAQSSNKVNYIRALVSCEEYQASVPAYAMALAGDKHSLMSRVKRIVSNRNHTLNLLEKTVLAVCLVVSGLCLSAFGPKANREYIEQKISTVINTIQKQSIDKSENSVLNKVVTQETKPDQSAKATSEVTDLSADTNKQHLPVVRDADGNASYLLKDSGRLVPIGGRLIPVNVNLAPLQVNTKLTLNNSYTVNASVDQTPEPDAADTRPDTPKNRSFNFNYKWQSKMHWQNKNGTKQNFTVHTQTNSNSDTVRVFVMPDTVQKPQPVNKLYEPSKLNIKHSQQLDGSGLMKLVDKSIKDKNNFKIVVNNKELIVDGVKQSEQLHQLALKKYVKYPDDKVDFTIAVSNSK